MQASLNKSLNLAITKYRDDKSIQFWVNLYNTGGHHIPKNSEWVLKNIEKAINLRERGLVYRGEQ